MIDWWKKVFLKNYANFSGRARRSEYWYFVLCNSILGILIGLPSIILFGVFEETDFGAVFMLPLIFFATVLIIPSIAVAVRRLHDTGKSGWLYLIGVIPIVSAVGAIILFIFYCLEGDTSTNKYGPNPKQSFPDNFIDDVNVRF